MTEVLKPALKTLTYYDADCVCDYLVKKRQISDNEWDAFRLWCWGRNESRDFYQELSRDDCEEREGDLKESILWVYKIVLAIFADEGGKLTLHFWW